MKKKILAIQGSDINKINFKTDTSMFLGVEAQKKENLISFIMNQKI